MAIHFDPNSAIDHWFLRIKTGIPAWLLFLCAFLCVFTAIYHFYGGVFGFPEALLHRSTHAVLFLMLTFLFYPLGRASWNAPLNTFFVIDATLMVTLLGIYIWIIRDTDAFVMRAAMPESGDIVVSTLFVLLALEGIRRTVGLSLVVLPVLFMLHALFADHCPSVLYASPTDYETLITYLGMDLDAMLGVPVSVASTFIIIFIFFGAFLVRTGAGNFFSDLAYAATGRLTGGPAKAATVASCLYGTLSGSTAANVVTTGSFTIPLMIKSGFRPQFAASVEAIASNGGQLMPPIMGAAAFIIPMYIPGTGFREVALAAFLPALLYYASLLTMIHFEARKNGLFGLPAEQLPRMGPIVREGWPLAFSLAAIIALLLYGFTPSLAGVAALLVTICVTSLKKNTRITLRDGLSALETGTRSVIPIAMACLAAGLIIGSVNLSGLSGRVTSMIVLFSQGQLWIALLITMFVCIIMGMGMTTTIIYITLAVLVVPSLVSMGATPMAANLFVFHFGCMSGVTPPVCLTTYAAAGIAHSSPWHTGWEAAKLGIASFIIPFMFVYAPALLLDGSPIRIVQVFLTSLGGVMLLACAVQGQMWGRLAPWERGLAALAAFGSIHPGLLTDAVALGLFLIVALRQVYGRKRLQTVSPRSGPRNPF